MRKLAVSTALVALLAAPTALASDRGKLTVGEALSATRASVASQVEALGEFRGLNVLSAHPSGRINRLGRRSIIVLVAFTLQWDDEPSFVCRNRVQVTEREGKARARPGHFDCY